MTDLTERDAPIAALSYVKGATRLWPWDVRVVIWMGIVYAFLQLLQGTWQAVSIVRDRNVSWFSGNAYGWYYVLAALLRSLLPSLLLVALIGFRSFKPGARRLALLTSGALLLFGVVEAVVSLVSMSIRTFRSDHFAGTLLSIAQSFLHGYALLLIIVVTMKRADVKSAADGIG